MNIKATFPAGVDALIVHGLHQWDYGRQLEIEADDLPALVEVHFACAGMKEAVVRSCAVVNGVATAAIPDQCLEQTAPIVAWVYEIDGTTGTTTKTVTLPVESRTRPQPGATVPQVISDRYTELISAVNEQVEALREGNVKVANAANADQASHATRAGTADIAIHATGAGTADIAIHATGAATADTAMIADYAGEAGSASRASLIIPGGGITISMMNEKALWMVGGLYLILEPTSSGDFHTELLLISSAGGTSWSNTSNSNTTAGCHYNHVAQQVSGNGAGYPYDTSYAYKIAQLN